MVDKSDQTERADRELNIVKRARFNKTIETRETNEVPEPKFGVEPHTFKKLPALPVRERQYENILLHQQLQDNILDEEVVNFGQRAQHQQEQQQLQLRQHNIPHNPVLPKQVMSPKRPNVETPNQGGPPGPEALYQQNNLLQQVVQLEWDLGLREIVQDNNSSIEQIVAEVRRINHAMGQITGGLNNVFGQVRKDAQNQSQGMALFHEQLVDVHRKLGILEKEATRLHQGEIGGLKERCRKIEQESVRTDRKWQNVSEQLQKIPELERELRASNQRIAVLERKLTERDDSPPDQSTAISGEIGGTGETAEGGRNLHRTSRTA